MTNNNRPVQKRDSATLKKPSLQSDLAWNPVPIEPPVVARDLPRLPWLHRVAEVFTYSIGRLEYWVSPSGVVREWFRLVFKVFLYLAIPAILLCPVISFILHQAVDWTAALLQIAINILYTFGIGIILVVIFRIFGGGR